MGDSALFGRYWPGDSVVHRLDPRVKLVCSLALMAVVFAARDWAGLAVCAAFVVAFYLAAGIPLGQAARSIAPLLIIVVMTALLNVLFVQGGQVYAQWGPLCVSEAGLRQAAFIAVRLTLLLLGMSLLTLTTTTLDITEAFERLLSPLARVGLPAHELGMMMGIALRFLPQFAEELRIIYRAQLSRGARLASNPLRGGASALTSLMVPLLTSAFRHAETLSAAMEARCYHGGAGRTRLHPLAVAPRDGGAAAALALMLAAVLAANALG
ncbi:MAG: energy-coupling factor transporter transmembrane protein EcfT [Eggerthellaceae bacterium]|nr:energy-coupling factor transporter transmembrane protein EcfT [Eggerthellaceae bacterium]